MNGLSDAADLDAALLALRVVVGVLMAMHGMQKLFGLFGGGGLAGTAGWFSSLGFKHGRTAAMLAGIGEIAGGLGLAAGLLTAASAAVFIAVMTTAAIVNHADGGFWSVSKGWELNLYLMVIAGFVAAAGPGRWSLDAALDLTAYGAVHAAVSAVAGVIAGSLTWVLRRRI
ncbi:MAG: DoxX family protein [Aeromicrobium sp.]|uniref:DoxX family protein n=1 Tax=Aeromicrobium sp. TaxID=1871063 RepID=UPI0039E263DF